MYLLGVNTNKPAAIQIQSNFMTILVTVDSFSVIPNIMTHIILFPICVFVCILVIQVSYAMITTC